MATRFIFRESFKKAIDQFKDPDDRLKAYEAICEYAINGTEPIVPVTETSEVKSSTVDETKGTEEGSAEERTVRTTTYTATWDNSFMALFEIARPVIDEDNAWLGDVDALEAKYTEVLKKWEDYLKQQEEKKSEEQTDTYGKPKTVEV